ncbi:Transcription factor bHLH93 [Platanthera guangdongensis]|uniref:Transcription factor bHLH93 n=1 Tax=Platanthera guangdongensis TaxID=2320717 RepID=A0ABR2MPR5_9ASPA
MELDEHAFLEELLALRRPEPWDSGDLFAGEPIPPLDCFPDAAAGYPPLDNCFNASDAYSQMISVGGMCAYYSPIPPEIPPDIPPDIPPEMSCKVEFPSAAADAAGTTAERRKKRAAGMPSKNLMAERRRRKRLNDRLSMLRSVVPKISKMDRTSILGDTIDYMKELLEKIKRLREDAEAGGVDRVNVLGLFKELGPNEIAVRNCPKVIIIQFIQFDVERRDGEARIEICCTAKPGLLLSTVSTLESLGLDIQQCVVSCFNDFGLQALCSENVEQAAAISSEDIKQALFRNAGYGGRCM